jgi:hypothetical protein
MSEAIMFLLPDEGVESPALSPIYGSGCPKSRLSNRQTDRVLAPPFAIAATPTTNRD